MNRCKLYYKTIEMEQLLFELILLQKIEIKDIPFEIRKHSRSIYIAANRATRNDEESHAQFIKLMFHDYDCLKDKRILNDLVETTFEWYKDILDKYEIKPPKDYISCI